MEAKLSYREYMNSDLDRCAELSVEAWPVIYKLADAENAKRFMTLYIEMCLLDSDYAQVCCDDENKVIGLLFGAISTKKPSKKERRKRGQLFADYINGKYGRIEKRNRFVISFFLTEMKVKMLCSRFQSQVVLFMVDKQHQGQGIGKKLMISFIDAAKYNSRKSIYLYTDIESNWMFYEKFGFRKHKTFHDNGLSVMLGEKVRSFIYFINI